MRTPPEIVTEIVTEIEMQRTGATGWARR